MTQRIYILLHGIGDLVNFLPVLFAHHARNNRASVMVSKQNASVLDGCSYVDPILFDGEPHELEKAYDEAKKLSDDVCCVQTSGPPDLVKKYTFEPSGIAHATTDSFTKESWKLAGSMALWKENHPVIFDRRDKKREAILREEHTGKLKPILIAANGISSPFAPASLLLELVRLHARKNRHHVVDLGVVKAERIYDLLGLYEKARCLIAIDSAPLHLAQACPDLPVLALVNDKPSYWHGAAWRSNHIFHCRYSDWTQRAVEMLSVIENLESDGSWSCKAKKSPRILHVFSRHEQPKSPLNWTSNLDGHWILCPAEPGVFGRDSKTALKTEQRQPFIKDMIKMAALRAQDSDMICLTRHDVGLSDDLANFLFQKGECYGHRSTVAETLNIERNTVPGEDRLTYHPSTDLFAFSKKFWKANEKSLPDLIYGSDVYWHRCMKAWMQMAGAKELEFAVFRDSEKLPKNEAISKYNETISKEWFVKTKWSLALPKVSEQIETDRINPKSLSPYGYNPSIAKYKNGYLLGYRWHHAKTHTTSLAIAEMDSVFNVTRNRPITIAGKSTEDIRFFSFREQIWCSYVESNYPNTHTSYVRYGQVVETKTGWTVEGQWQVQYGLNDGLNLEKNWLFFEHEGKLLCIYQTWPEQIVIEVDGYKVVNEWRTPVEHWKWGQIRGGALGFLEPGKMIRFFHSSLHNEPSPYKARYYLGAMEVEDKPPFQSKLISQKPIVKGSENDDLNLPDRLACQHHKPQVIFPGGCVTHADMWLLACGINDCESAILKIKRTNL